MTRKEECNAHPDACLDWAVYYPILALLLFGFLLPTAHGDDRKAALEEAQFDIYVAGKKVGQEKFTVQSSGDSISSHSILSYRDPGNRHQNVRTETQLTMDAQCLPRTYQLRTDVDGRKGTLTGTFVPGQANMQYQGNGNPRKSGLLVGDHYIILDTNVFHHFIFVARLFNFDVDKPQSIEVVIPQELDYGILKVSKVGVEKISVRRGGKALHHLRADSGRLQIDLWIDDQRILYKIALPAKGIEVIRNP